MRLQEILIVGSLVGAWSTPAAAQCWELSAELIKPSSYSVERVSIEGDTLLVGNHWFVGGGRAWIYERDVGGTWQEVGPLLSPTVISNDAFGWAVSLAADVAVVGARGDDASAVSPGQEGAVYVFERDIGGPGAWGQAARLLASDGQTADRFGGAVSISGDRIAVGADGADFDGDDDAGAVYVFERDQGGPNAWGEVARLNAPIPTASSGFGLSVAISSDTLLVGSPHTDGDLANTGTAHVFERNPGAGNPWLSVASLNPAPPVLSAEFGQSVALVGDEALVGAARDRVAGIDAGSAYLFERDLGGPQAWGQARKFVPYDGKSNDRFGVAVSMAADRIVVGAMLDSVGPTTSDSVRGSAFDPNAGVLYGVLPPGTLVTIDPATGTDTVVGETGFLNLRALAFDPGASVLYGYTSSPRVLLAIDTLTAAATMVGAPGTHFVTGMAFDPGTGVLYGADAQLGPDLLVSIDTTTGAVTPIGGIGFDNINSLGVDPVSGKLYASTDGTGASQYMLIEIDPVTGAGSVVGDSPLQILPLESMAFDAISRTMYGTQPEVVQPPGDDACLSIVDIATGAVTPYFFYKVGSAYVFGRDFGGTESWGLEEKLDDSVVSLSAFGESVSISGATVAVGAGGRRTVEVWDPLPADAATYCTAGTSVSGCRAVLSACGVSSASAASGFWLRANRVEGAKKGLFFFGANGRQAQAWGNGSSFQCVVPPVKRASLLLGSGTTASCDGSFSQDLNALWCPVCPKPNHNPGAGVVVQAQLWYRDPLNTSNQTTSLSDAIEFSVGP